MADNINLAAIYGDVLTPAQKENLRALYKDFISLKSAVDCLLYRYSVEDIAKYQLKRLNGDSKYTARVLGLTDEELQIYDDFMYNQKPDYDHNICYVRLDLTDKQKECNYPVMRAAPKDFTSFHGYHALPSYVERFIAAFPEDQKLKDAVFVVDGRYSLSFSHAEDDLTVLDALQHTNFLHRFKQTLEGVEAIPRSYYFPTSNDLFALDVIYDISGGDMALTLEQKEMIDKFSTIPMNRPILKSDILKMAENASLVCSFLAPIEGAMLGALTTLTEEENNAFKALYERRLGKDYLEQAYKDKMITSVASFQDYLNLRNFMRHQLDTLSGFGRYRGSEDKNAEVRARYQASYCRLCNTEVEYRLKNYTKAAEDFYPFIKMITPNLLRREKSESNNKFVTRLKSYAKANPDMPLWVETGYSYSNPKKEQLIKNIIKVLPQAEILDYSNINKDEFALRSQEYGVRSEYLHTFQKIDIHIRQFCLFSGKDLETNEAWDYLRQKKVLNAEESKKWAEFKKLRNILSHRHLDSELAMKTLDMLPDLWISFDELKDKTNDLIPEVKLLHNNIYQARHKDGTLVDFNIVTRKTVSINNQKIKTKPSLKQEKQKPEKSLKPNRTESYENGVKIMVKNNRVTGFINKKGVEVDLEKEKIIFPDGAKFYFSGDTTNALVLTNKTKIVTDKAFRVLNYVVKGKSVALGKNEKFKPENKHTVTTDNKGCVKSHQMTLKPYNEQLSFNLNGDVPEVLFADGTKLTLTPKNLTVSRSGITLNNETTKAFAESFDDGSVPVSTLIKAGTGR